MDLDEYRRSSLAIWDRMAPGWHDRRDRLWEFSRPIGMAMVERLAPEAGQTILELAAGPGDTGFAAAAALGDDGRLISSDFSEAMVETARRRARELGVENVEFRVIDAERIDLPDDSVDGVLCRWAYMLMADAGAALAETRRVLRPGGRLVFTVWAEAERNPWGSIPGLVLVERGHFEPPAPGQPGVFALARQDALRALVQGAGFERVEIEEARLVWKFTDEDDFWSFLMEFAGAFSLVLAALPEHERATVRAAIAERLEPFQGDDGGIPLPAVSLTVTAA